MNLICAGKYGSINMIELDAKQIPDEVINEAFALAQEKINEMCEIQKQYLAQFTLETREIKYNKPSVELLDYVRTQFTPEWYERLIGNTKTNFNKEYYAFHDHVFEITQEQLNDESLEEYTNSKLKMAIFQIVKEVIRDRTLHQNLRVDNRTMEDIRPLFTQIDTVPRVHGSGLFWRGDTQVLSSVTLGAV